MEPPPFSLGNAILRTADSPVHAPDTFRDDLLHKHLDAASRAAVAQTCTAGLTWVLTEWPEATLRLAVRAASDHLPSQLPQRLQVMADQLSLRGDKPTTLALVQRGWQVARDDPGVRATVSALQWPNPPAAFTLTLQLQYICSELLSQGSAAFAGLTSLVLGPASGPGCSEAVLPAPSALPALRHLTVQRVARSAQVGLWASVATYMRQLQSLVISEQPGETFRDDEDAEIDRPLWGSLFSPSTATKTLQRVSLPWPLQPWLSILLERHAPSVQELTVKGACGVEGFDDISPQCSWTALRCTDVIHLEAWSWLPVPQGTLVIELLAADEDQRCVFVPLDMIHAVSHKISHLALKRCDTLLLAANEVPAEEQPQALRDALPHITPLRTPTTDLQLEYFTITPQLAAELAPLQAAGWSRVALSSTTWHRDPPAPPLPGPLPLLYYLGLPEYTLDDKLLQDIVQWCPALRWLRVGQLGLSGPVTQDCVVPWETVFVDRFVSISEWLQHSEWLGRGLEWVFKTFEVSLTPEEVGRGEHHRIAQQLKKARITKLYEVVMCAPDGDSGDASLLRASFTVLRALPCKPKELGFQGWRATPAVVSEFRALSSVPVLQQATPHSTTLSLRLISSAVEHGIPDMWTLARLPQLVPTRAFDVWRVDARSLLPRDLEAFICGTPAHCSEQEYVWGQHSLSISVSGRDEAWAESMRARLAAQGTYEHVTLTVG